MHNCPTVCAVFDVIRMCIVVLIDEECHALSIDCAHVHRRRLQQQCS